MNEDITQQSAQPAQPDAHVSGNHGTEPAATSEQPRLFTQADLDRQIEQRLERERQQAATRAERDRKAEADKQAAQQGEWQRLADERGARVADLEAAESTREAEVDAYRTRLKTLVKAQTKGWPDDAKKALPETDDPLELADAVDRLTPLALRLRDAEAAGAAVPPPRAGAPAAPRPAGGMLPGDAARQAEVARLRARGGYTPS